MARARNRISVREALRLRKRVRELEMRLGDVLAGGWPGPVIAQVFLSDIQRAKVETTQRLGFSLVVRYNGVDTISLHAVRVAV